MRSKHWVLVKDVDIVTYCLTTSVFDASAVGLRSKLNLITTDRWLFWEWKDFMDQTEFPLPHLQYFLATNDFCCVRVRREEEMLDVHEDARIDGRTGPNMTVSYVSVREVPLNVEVSA